MKKYLSSFRKWYQGLPDKKRYLELVTATLSIPVLITVILNNVTLLKQKQTTPDQTPTPVLQDQKPITIVITPDEKEKPEPIASQSQLPKSQDTSDETQCDASIGPVQILSPKENEIFNEFPVCIDIQKPKAPYCSVVWSYRINSTSWSDFTDKAICLYDLPPGKKVLEIRIKSIVSGEEKLLTTTFDVAQEIQPTSSDATSSSEMRLQ